MKKAEPDYYAVMGVKRDAALGAIKQAYRELVRRYHPDAAGDDPQAPREFELLQAAYETLSDPAKRAQYDKSLPRQKYPLAELEPEHLWREVTELILERSDAFEIMIQAMRAAAPIAVEGNLLVVGLAGKDQYLSGHLETPANRYRITGVLCEVSGQEIEYRVIEGTTQEDWDWVKRAEGRKPHLEPPPPPPGAKAGKEPRKERPAKAPQVTAWELLARKIQNTWQNTPNRQHPLTRAEFVLTCVNWISEEAKAATGDGAQRDAIHREVGKAVERIAQLLDLPATVVALELVRSQPRRRAS
jgi:DnaJ-domain-containing protein 1